MLVPLVLVPVPVGGERLDADRAQKPARRFVPLRVPQVVGLVQENLVANLSPTGTRRKLTRQTKFRLDLMKSSKKLNAKRNLRCTHNGFRPVPNRPASSTGTVPTNRPSLWTCGPASVTGTPLPLAAPRRNSFLMFIPYLNTQASLRLTSLASIFQEKIDQIPPAKTNENNQPRKHRREVFR